MSAVVEGNYRLPLRIFVDTLLARGAIWAEPVSAASPAGAVNPADAGSRRERVASSEQAATA
jgi:hypothetical protein